MSNGAAAGNEGSHHKSMKFNASLMTNVGVLSHDTIIGPQQCGLQDKVAVNVVAHASKVISTPQRKSRRETANIM